MTYFMQKTQKDLRMTHNNKDLEKIYKEVFKDALDYMEDHEVQAVAATYMAIAMRLYKTHLDEKGVLSKIRTVMETEVRPYEKPKKVLH